MRTLEPGMWVLLMNDMRSSQIEILSPVCCAESKEALQEFLDSERVTGYNDGRWGKSFRKDGPLEWKNEPWSHDEHKHFVQWFPETPPMFYHVDDLAGLGPVDL